MCARHRTKTHSLTPTILSEFIACCTRLNYTKLFHPKRRAAAARHHHHHRRHDHRMAAVTSLPAFVCALCVGPTNLRSWSACFADECFQLVFFCYVLRHVCLRIVQLYYGWSMSVCVCSRVCVRVRQEQINIIMWSCAVRACALARVFNEKVSSSFLAVFRFGAGTRVRGFPHLIIILVPPRLAAPRVPACVRVLVRAIVCVAHSTCETYIQPNMYVLYVRARGTIINPGTSHYALLHSRFFVVVVVVDAIATNVRRTINQRQVSRTHTHRQQK